LTCAILLTGLLAQGQYLERTIKGSTLPYLGYVPASYESGSERWPLLIFLHGKGEKGDGSAEEIEKVKRWGPPSLVEEEKMPGGFIIIAPQLPSSSSAWELKDIHDLINHATSNFKVDPSRIYLTGISLGGNATWRYAYSSYNEPNKLAAIIPVAAWGDSSKVCKLVENEIAVWAFHGKEDRTIAYDRGLSMLDAIQKCGDNLSLSDYRMTGYDDVGHNSWTKAFLPSTPDLSVYEWLLIHKKRSGSGHDRVNNSIQLETISNLPASLTEASGIIRGVQNTLWLHNDSGNDPFLIQLDHEGTITDHIKIIFASNYDWEDLARDANGNIYIGDIGNNGNLRRQLIIYKIDPEIREDNRVKAEQIKFSYPEQQAFPPSPSEMNYDAEALIHYQNQLYIFTKNRTVPFTGYTYIYRVPDKPGTYNTELVDSLNLRGTNMIDGWITGADISPDQKRIVLVGHDKIHLLTCFENGFSNAKITTFTLDSFTQKEAIAFSDNNTLWLADENFQNLLQGKLYRYILDESANSGCD